MSTGNEIILTDLCKSFGELTVLRNFSAAFPVGEITCLMGPSGCGKTTLLRILAGLETPDSGKILNLPAHPSCIFQEDRLCEDFSPLTNLRMVTGKKLSAGVLADHLTRLGLGDSLHRPVRELSGGMKRRVAIARGIVYDAGLLLMDEPFKGLDEETRRTVMDYVREETRGKTVLCVTHAPEEADYLGGRLLSMTPAAQETPL